MSAFDSFLFFLPLCRVCRSFNFDRKIWRVQVANLHSGARALSCPSRCHKLDKIFFRHLLCWDAATVFANAIRLLQLRVFLQQSKILYWEINYTRSLETSNNTEIKNIIVIRVGQRKRYRNFADYLCCLPIFPAKLLICSQTLISLKRI